ncbi:MAG TPA: M24 family metallopeptidase [Sutterellaceae bacterium]|nr:M24 family metallopeptidase [Sutterellaceae bacterium]
MSEIKSRLLSLRSAIKTMGADAFYCTLSDAHLSEYIQKTDQFLSFLSGFTGSNAELLVTADEAFLWTDSRYWEQAERQLLNSGIALMRDGEKGVPSVAEWLSEVNAKKSTVLALTLETLPMERYKKIQESVTKVIDFPDEAITKQWPDRPKRDVFPLYIHRASSVSAADKRKRLQEYIESVDIQGSPSALLLTKLDDIAWLTNLRGSDIAFNPVFLSWALVMPESAILFLHDEILEDRVAQHLNEAGWTIAPYALLEKTIEGFIGQGGKVLARENDLNAKLYSQIKNAWVPVKHPVPLWKSVKTREEIAGLKEVMKADGEALQAFIDELKVRLANGEKLTENDAVDILHQKRSATEGFIGESFGTIAAVDANAALPHYEPEEGKGAQIVPPCILLVDSGAHYDRGTTDTTRVWFLGDPKDYPQEKLQRLKRDYTAVFLAMKTLSEATFKPGTNGVELDRVARAPIQAIGADFGHGTGHGIGLTLNVHETPPSISPREREGTLTPFEPGMVTSDEPGIYRPGEWGIRIENMLVCVEKEDGMLGFEALTQCEIDRTLLIEEI